MKIDINFIEHTLKYLITLLNDNDIDFFLVGSIGAFIDAGIPIQRIHDDIDIMIEEKSINKLKFLFKTSDFNFYDNRMTSDKYLNNLGYTDGEHEVIAKYKYNDFHIGFFLYKKSAETYTIIEYFKSDSNQKRLDRTLPINFFDYQYNPIPHNYNGLRVKTVRKETIYKNKSIMNREKDIFDMQLLKPYIDLSKLERLSGMKKYRHIEIADI